MKKTKHYILLTLFLAPLLILLVPIIKWQPGDTRPYLQRLQFEFEADGEKITIFPWFDDQSGEVILFLPSCAPDNLTVIPPDDIEINGTESADIDPVNSQPMTVNASGDIMRFKFKDHPEENGRITIMRGGEVGSVFINLPGNLLKLVHDDKNNNAGSMVSIFNKDGESQYNGLAVISGRGGSTWKPAKKPYNMTLEEDAGLFGMAPGRTWAMLANYYDDAHIRNKLVYNMALDLGLPFSFETEFTDVYINGEYRGLYLFCEKTDRVISSVPSMRELERATQEANPAPLDSYPFLETSNLRGFDIPNNPEDISGGYYAELELWHRYGNANGEFITDMGQQVKLRAPKFPSVAQVDYIRNATQNMENIIYTNPDADLNDIIYVDEWAGIALLQEVVANHDGGISSAFYYKEAGDSRLHTGAAWDFDCTLGNTYPTARYPQGLHAMDNAFYQLAADAFEPVSSYGAWYAKMYQNSGFREEVERLYRDEFLPVINKIIDQDIDECVNISRASQQMDGRRWAKLKFELPPPNIPVPGGTPDEQAEFIRDFLIQRRDFLSDLWINHAEYVTVAIVPEWRPMFHLFAVKPGETVGDYIDKNIPDLQGKSLVIYNSDEPFDLSVPVFEEVWLSVAASEEG